MLPFQGTWVFMSALALNYPRKPSELADDLESFHHVLCWMGIRYHKHNLTGNLPELEPLIRTYYEAYRHGADGSFYGSTAKYDAMVEGRVPIRLDPETCANLRNLLQKLVGLCSIHYAAVDKSALIPFGKPMLKKSGPTTKGTDEEANRRPSR